MILTENLTYAYPRNGSGIGPLNLAIECGEIVHIHNSSGAGKSTLARCITGIIPHLYHGNFGGNVFLDGMNTREAPLWKLSGKAGLVFQNPSLQMMASTVEEEIIIGLENLGLSRNEILSRLEKTLEEFHLAPMRLRAPQTLSGGEQQKLALASITARQPRVLVLDEPLSMLDVPSAYELVSFLEHLSAQGMTIVAFEHREDHLAEIPSLRTLNLEGNGFPRRRTAVLPSHGSAFPLAGHNGKLTLDDVSVSLSGQPVLNKLNLSISCGEVTAIVGRNGSGKTTLLRAIAGLQEFSGAIKVDGESAELGIVFQNAEFQLFNSSVKNEILYGVKRPDPALYEWIINALGLREYEHTPPLILSEGEKKRVSLGAILMTTPKHGLLLDEPSLGQDASHRKILVSIARSIAAGGKIVVMTTHDLHLASEADRLILLGHDGIAADGPPGVVFLNDIAWRKAGMFVPAWIKKKYANTHHEEKKETITVGA